MSDMSDVTEESEQHDGMNGTPTSLATGEDHVASIADLAARNSERDSANEQSANERSANERADQRSAGRASGSGGSAAARSLDLFACETPPRQRGGRERESGFLGESGSGVAGARANGNVRGCAGEGGGPGSPLLVLSASSSLLTSPASSVPHALDAFSDCPTSSDAPTFSDCPSTPDAALPHKPPHVQVLLSPETPGLAACSEREEVREEGLPRFCPPGSAACGEGLPRVHLSLESFALGGGGTAYVRATLGVGEPHTSSPSASPHARPPAALRAIWGLLPFTSDVRRRVWTPRGSHYELRDFSDLPTSAPALAFKSERPSTPALASPAAQPTPVAADKGVAEASAAQPTSSQIGGPWWPRRAEAPL
ncbi:hypothetical protein T492DRAFT_991698 [Pavlovales sp. CCMP2436]|nr:hypothetical protein T492DRAFT_991698 [Pavlovales sp. CCMP2436]